jgi:hypothetical protein
MRYRSTKRNLCSTGLRNQPLERSTDHVELKDQIIGRILYNTAINPVYRPIWREIIGKIFYREVENLTYWYIFFAL